MKIIFFGTPSPAAVCLKMLLNIQEEVVYVISQPDRKKGRGQTISSAPVKEVAIQNDIPVETPGKIQDKLFIEKIKYLKPDLIIVVAYGKILPKEILEIPKHGAINLHASLLPKYRGAAPIQYALLNGEKETGITVMKLDEGLDTGEIILQEKVAIESVDTTETLLAKLFAQGSQLLLQALAQIKDGTAKYQKQKESDVTYAPLLDKEAGTIDWQKPALDLDQRVRAMIPWPGAQTFFRGKSLKLWQVKPVGLRRGFESSPVGTIIEIIKNQGFVVMTGNGSLLVLEVQAAGKNRVSAYQFAIGHDVKIGESL